MTAHAWEDARTASTRLKPLMLLRCAGHQRCVHDVNQKVGSGKIVKVLRGSKAQDLNYLHPADLPTYGMLSATSEAQIRDVLSQMATDGFLSISEAPCRLFASVNVRRKRSRRIFIMKSRRSNGSTLRNVRNRRP